MHGWGVKAGMRVQARGGGDRGGGGGVQEVEHTADMEAAAPLEDGRQ